MHGIGEPYPAIVATHVPDHRVGEDQVIVLLEDMVRQIAGVALSELGPLRRLFRGLLQIHHTDAGRPYRSTDPGTDAAAKIENRHFAEAGKGLDHPAQPPVPAPLSGRVRTGQTLP